VEKYQQNQDSISSSLALGTLMFMYFIHSYIMGDKIRKMGMNVAFKYIWLKSWVAQPMEGLSIFT